MIYTSSAIPDEIPDLDLANFILGAAKTFGDKPAMIDGASGRTVSYADLGRAVRSVAAGLSAAGFEKGDTFCICMPNVPEYPIAFHGVLAAGGRCTTANPLYTARELSHQLADTEARMLLTTPPFLEVAREAAADAGCELYVLGNSPEATPFETLLGDPDAAPDVAIDPAKDVAAILYSGGTTGMPKGVLLSHRNLVASIVQSAPAFGLTSADVVIAVLPFFHVYGLQVILNRALFAGATVVTMARFDLEQFVDLLEHHQVTRGYAVPPIVLGLATDAVVEGRDLSALRNVLSGAAPLPLDLAEACERRIGCPVTQAYGMTEMSSATHLAPLFGDLHKPGSIGPPRPGTECRLVDPEVGEDAGEGEPGELWLRGPHVMLGYLHNPEATAATVNNDGWLRTGDIATVDEDGWFTVVARIKEIIKYKGFQVAPAELESILLGHPQVADCAVIGVADEEAGEVPKAFIVPAQDSLDVQSLLSFVSERVAPHKRIRMVEIIDEIPKSQSGRILRRLLEERERSA
jgi:acyl-CoA synthetase (AMP-forming)/AMP-acid ligase II